MNWLPPQPMQKTASATARRAFMSAPERLGVSCRRRAPERPHVHNTTRTSSAGGPAAASRTRPGRAAGSRRPSSRARRSAEPRACGVVSTDAIIRRCRSRSDRRSAARPGIAGRLDDAVMEGVVGGGEPVFIPGRGTLALGADQVVSSANNASRVSDVRHERRTADDSSTPDASPTDRWLRAAVPAPPPHPGAGAVPAGPPAARPRRPRALASGSPRAQRHYRHSLSSCPPRTAPDRIWSLVAW